MAMEARPRVLHVSATDRTPAHQDREDGPDPIGTKEPSSPRLRRPMLTDMEITPRRRRVFATALAFVLAIESVSAVAAAGLATTALRDAPRAAPAPVANLAHATASVARKARVTAAVACQPVTRGSPRAGGRDRAQGRRDQPAPRNRRQATRRRLDPPTIRIKPAAHRTSRATPAAGKQVRPASFTGRNHVWIPALGMNRSISSFACSRSREPDNYVYRWGCAGSNNVYLLGHAWGVMKPLHDAYTSGRLKVGMKVWYADSSGRVTAYAVRWWKVVKPTTAASWAWASQATRSMTLQTCVGAKSQNRLMVRLTAVH